MSRHTTSTLHLSSSRSSLHFLSFSFSHFFHFLTEMAHRGPQAPLHGHLLVPPCWHLTRLLGNTQPSFPLLPWNFLPSNSWYHTVLICLLFHGCSFLVTFSRSSLIVPQSLICDQLCDPMDCSTPGSSVLRCLPSLLKFTSIESVVLSNHLLLYLTSKSWSSSWCTSLPISSFLCHFIQQ